MVSHNYYLKIVPTVYTNSSSNLLSNKYSVYDITPFMHYITEKRMSLAHFFVRICAVIGGVAAVPVGMSCNDA